MTSGPTLITGASSDIGIALIRRLASSGTASKILAHYHSGGDRLEQLCAELGGSAVCPLQADLSSLPAVEEFAARIRSDFGVPAGMVHFPALKVQYERFPKASWSRFEQDLNLQLRSAVVLLQRFLPAMAKLPAARVVFVLSSVTRGVPPKFMSMYSVAKHAQLGLMRALASEYGETSVTFNAVSPSMVDTRFLELIPDIARQMSAAASPRKRHATPDEVARAIEFLMSDGAAYINGVELPVAGGSVY